MPIGKLYGPYEEQFVTNVNYRLLGQVSTSFWGELIPAEYAHISEGGGYTVELEDNCKISCNLQKRVNRAVTGTPPRFVYHFEGTAAR